MSRIHEALKKAELERGSEASTETPAAPSYPDASTASSVETPAPAFKPFAPTPERNGEPGTVVGVLTATREIPSTPGEGVLQLNDILERCARPNWSLDPKSSVFSGPGLTADGAEQFRTLRSRLYQMRNGQSSQTLLITSSLPGEGKTFVTSNLGQAIVRQHERRALIIDADLRRSNLHKLLGAPSSPGLSDYLRGDADLVSVIQQGLRGNMCFIPAGNAVSNPTELLANGRLKILLECVASAFDWVLIDSPPYLPVADANILADSCDGVLLVVKARSTSSEVVGKTGRELQGRNVLGVIMNGVEEAARGYRSRYGSSYHNLDYQSSRE